MKRSVATPCIALFFASAALHAQTLGVDKNPLNFSAQPGGPKVTQLLNVTGSGQFNTFPNATWLTVAPANGSAPSALTVTADPTGLAPGVYGGDLFIFGSNQVDVRVNLTISNISVNPASVAFAYQTGATAPATQTINLAGPPSTYTATATSTGNWLQISTAASIAPGTTIIGSSPGTILASVNFNALAVLPPGTSGGSIVITPASGTSPITIPAAVFVSAAPPVTISPSSVSLAFQIGGNNNSAQQSVTLSTTGIQSISYTAFASVDPNPSGQIWIKVLPSTNGTISANEPAQFTIAYDSTKILPATGQPGCTPSGCTYTGNVALSTPGGVPAITNIPVSLFVSSSPLLSVPANTLNFTYQIATATPAQQSVTVNSTNGSPTLMLAATTANNSGNWLSVPTAATAGSPFQVEVNPTGLAPGSYTGTVTVTLPGAANSPLQIAVNLKVTNDPVIVAIVNGCSTASFSGCSVVFASQVGQAPAPVQSIRVSSSTGVSLNYTATASATSCGGNWLAIGGGTIGSTDGVFSAVVNPSGIATGTTCNGTISINATNPATSTAAPNNPLQVPVTLYVSSTPLLVFNPSALTFSGQLNGPVTPIQTITLASTSSTDVVSYNVAFSTANNANWLIVSPPSGIAGAAGNSVTVLANPGILSAGTYQGSITITATGPAVADSPVTIPVIFQVNAGTISATPASVNFTQVAGGAAPASQTVMVSGAPNAINYGVTAAGGTWLTATPATSATPGSVQISANAGTLAVGSYTGKVTITAATPPGASGSPVTISVTLNVVAAQTLTASPNNVNFTYTTSAPAPASQTVALSSTGGAAPFTVKVDQGTDSWLTVTPASGNTAANTPTTLTLAANPMGLAAKKYTAVVTISSSSALTPATVTVTLTVSTPIPPLVTSINNAASYSTTGVSPGENIVIFGTGLGPDKLVSGTVTNNVWNNIAGGVQVTFDGVAAPVIYASGLATSVMVPYGVAGRQSTSIVVSYQNVQSAPLVYNVVQAAPGIYSQNASGAGPGAILNQDGSVNGPANPAAKDTTVSVYMTGEGVTTPAGIDGALAAVNGTSLNKPQLAVSATVAGIPANVEYAGSAPTLIYGVMQVNVHLPANTPTGAQPIVIRLGASPTAVSFSTQNGITVAVQ